MPIGGAPHGDKPHGDEPHGDEIYDVMRCAPSTRNFTAEPVGREELERVLDNARYAPSGGNRQGWRVIVITDRDIRRRLRELYQEPWDAYMVRTGGRAALDAGEASGLPAARLRSLRGADEYARRFDEVPVHLLVGVDVNALAITDESLERPSIVGGASIYPFVQNLLLGLRREGLGAAFTTLLVPAEPAIRELLAIPEEIALAGHISVGHRADPWPKRLSRRPVSEFAFGDRYGQPW
ncbi:MAG TPA: nitroreductase family protein [Solirubrobacteraceae bacterium]|nr:nitroreductase family protein [Solirubrobacteraceae bacterium]